METSTQEQQPTELKPLQEAQNQQSTTEQTVVIERMETPNTTTEIRREQHHAAKPVETPVKEEPKAEPKTEVSTANTEEQPLVQPPNKTVVKMMRWRMRLQQQHLPLKTNCVLRNKRCPLRITCGLFLDVYNKT